MKRTILTFGIGYPIAVLVAVTTTVTLYFMFAFIVSAQMPGTEYPSLAILPSFFLLGVIYTAPSALPGFAIAMVIAWKTKQGNARYYAIFGVFTAVLAHVLCALIHPDWFNVIGWLFFASLFGGALGGLAYSRWQYKFLSEKVEYSDNRK